MKGTRGEICTFALWADRSNVCTVVFIQYGFSGMNSASGVVLNLMEIFPSWFILNIYFVRASIKIIHAHTRLAEIHVANIHVE